MSDFWSYPEVSSSSGRHHGTKRGRSGDSPELSVRKRSRPSVDIASLSPSQVSILAQAAAILQVDMADLPKTLGRPSQGLVPNNTSQVIHAQQVPLMDSMPSRSQTSKTTKFSSRIPSHSSGTQQEDSGEQDICGIPGFNLGLMPKQISDCLAGFVSPNPVLTPPESQGDESSYYTGMTMTDSPTLLIHSNSQLSSSSSYGLLKPEPSTGFDLLDANSSHIVLNSHYACDEFTQGAEEWLLSNDQLFMPQYNQPYAPPPSMVYPLEPEVEDDDNLISFGGAFESRKARNSTGVQDQVHAGQPGDLVSHAYLDSSDSLEDKPQVSDLETGKKSQRMFATPRRRFHADDRQKTAQTRKLTACVRCRMQRIRCDADPSNPKGACLTCQKVLKPTLHKLPCLRYKLTDVRLFREGSYAAGREWSHRWSSNRMDNITRWASSELKQIQVTQDYSPAPLIFTVRQFVPVKGDMLDRQWSDGTVTKSVTLPNYAFHDMAEALQVHKDFITNEGPHFFKSTLDYNDRLLWDTYSTAIWYSNAAKSSEERELLQLVLQLWVTIRMCTRSGRIVGPETLGMQSDLMDKSSPMHGKIPIPPVMGAQIQLIITHKLQAPLRSKILAKLQKLSLEQRPDNWFCLYLCTFVLLHNCSLLTAHDVGYARKHGLKSRHARPDMVKELHIGANVLLAHFHYGCKGCRPFDLDWKPDLSTSMATLDDEQIRFLKQTANYVDYNGHRFKKLLVDGVYENEHYFVAQMYEEDWKPRLSVE